MKLSAIFTSVINDERMCAIIAVIAVLMEAKPF
jgi:hypothetical protein